MKLSDKSKYPLLFRTCSAESFGNPSRIAVMKHFNWKRVATIVQDEGVFTMVRHVSRFCGRNTSWPFREHSHEVSVRFLSFSTGSPYKRYAV